MIDPAFPARDAGGHVANPFLTPILDRLAAQPEAMFGAFLIEGAWQHIDNATFLKRSRAFAHALAALELDEGALVFLILEHGVDAPAAFIGAMLASATPSFLPFPNVKQDEASYWQQHAEIFALARPGAIVCFAALADELRARVAHLGILVLTVPPVAEVADDLPGRIPQADAVALVQHSSGTTGLKKGIALSYEAIARQLASYREALGLDEIERPVIVSWLPLYHDMGLIAAFLQPIWAGIPIVSIDPFEWVAKPGLQLDAIERFEGTHLWLPNFAFIHLARRVPAGRHWNLSSLRAVISCSEPCKPEAFDLFATRFAESGVIPEMLQTCYAMAETVFAVTQSTPGLPVRRIAIDRNTWSGENLARIVPLGTADSLSLLSNGPCIPGSEIAILGPQGMLPERGIGEICVQSDYLFCGYRRNPEATARAFVDGWYRTGDIGFMHDSEVYVVGRIKEVLIVNGKNIYAHDVEASIADVPGVKPGRSVAFGHYSDRYGSEQLVIVAETDGTVHGSEETASRINRAVLAAIGIACSDVRIVPPGWLVKTTSGKVSRSSNAAKYAAMLSG